MIETNAQVEDVLAAQAEVSWVLAQGRWPDSQLLEAAGLLMTPGLDQVDYVRNPSSIGELWRVHRAGSMSLVGFLRAVRNSRRRSRREAAALQTLQTEMDGVVRLWARKAREDRSVAEERAAETSRSS